ncbi:MAG: 2-oxoacid:acceptor oxidoreductase family protein, partial [Actinomycetia bacterium]|nr:2-oxoacid:acceptor oxidoreductase family protein [Actinomycetes bacterium]
MDAMNDEFDAKDNAVDVAKDAGEVHYGIMPGQAIPAPEPDVRAEVAAPSEPVVETAPWEEPETDEDEAGAAPWWAIPAAPARPVVAEHAPWETRDAVPWYDAVLADDAPEAAPDPRAWAEVAVDAPAEVISGEVAGEPQPVAEVEEPTVVAAPVAVASDEAVNVPDEVAEVPEAQRVAEVEEPTVVAAPIAIAPDEAVPADVVPDEVVDMPDEAPAEVVPDEVVPDEVLDMPDEVAEVPEAPVIVEAPVVIASDEVPAAVVPDDAAEVVPDEETEVSVIVETPVDAGEAVPMEDTEVPAAAADEPEPVAVPVPEPVDGAEAVAEPAPVEARRKHEPRYPGVPDVINGNGAVSYVMKHVCGGMIGYPITPSTEISENFEAARAEGQLNVWGKHPFFVEAEGEHSGQSGALGAALAGGNYVSNASSAQGILYGMESHFVTVGHKVGGFVLQVAARVVSKASLNVMAGHDDVYALLPSGYTVLFASNQQEIADLAAIGYRTAALSLIPVANAMDGFATSHVMSEVMLPEPELLKEYLGDPAGRIPCPTVAQEILFGAKGRVFQLKRWLDRHARDLRPDDVAALVAELDANPDAIEADDTGARLRQSMPFVPEPLRGQWRRAWLGAYPKGTRQRVPALVDPHNPGLTGPVQNQPDFQAAEADHRTHFANAVPALVRQAMSEYADLTGRDYAPILCYDTDDADFIMVALGSISEDIRAILPYLRSQGIKAGVVSVKLLQPFPEAELAKALAGAKSVMVLERSDDTALTRFVTGALFKARANTDDPGAFPGMPAIGSIPRLVTAIYGLGSHDVQPRHLIAAYKYLADGPTSPLIYIGSQFFDPKATGTMAALQDKLRAAYPETELMALKTEPNPPHLLPKDAMRIRFHSVGGYGTIATGKLLTDILAGMLGMHSKSAPKYGSEKSGAATNYYITVSPEPVLFTNNDIEDVEVVMSPDHVVFQHTNPLKGLVDGGTFILQSNESPLDVW